MIEIAPGVRIDERELGFTYILASGPGGQNVNKVATAAQLRFDARGSALPEAVKARLAVLAGSRMTQDGVIVITARRFRSQQRNREDAIERLAELIRDAADRPVKRRPTRPTLGSRTRRLAAKAQRGAIKRGRSQPADD